MAEHLEVNPATHVTIGTEGVPGNRTFYLQGSKGVDVISIVIEKQQASMLAMSFESLLEDLTKQQLLEVEADDAIFTTDLRLREPIDPYFRAGNLGLGFSEEMTRIVIVAYELVEEGVEPDMVSFWATPSQIRALIPHIRQTIKSGRPICGNCGDPINQDGHFCPRRNGHLH